MTIKKQVSLYLEVKDFEDFNKRYPRILSEFLRKAIKKANNDKNFFDLVFFGDIIDS